MILVLDNEIDPDLRYLGPELVQLLPEAEYHVFPDAPANRAIDDLDGIVLSGSTASVYDPDHSDWITSQITLLDRCIEAEVPILGICFGHQLVNYALGGTVVADTFHGGFEVMTNVNKNDELLQGIDLIVPVVHEDIVTEPGDGMVRSASTSYSEYFCTCHESAPIWTVQFHPELTRRNANRIDEFQADVHSFDDTNAGIVLNNFATVCGRNPV